MADILTALDTKELVLVLVALLGLIPVFMHYRDQSKWFALGYVFLLVGAFATNLEVVAFEPVFNAIEHGVGMMGAGIAFLLAAYLRRQAVVEDDSEGAGLLEAVR